MGALVIIYNACGEQISDDPGKIYSIYQNGEVNTTLL